MDYREALQVIHACLKPKSYVEIGCREGLSLMLARCPSIAIDPDFEIKQELQAPARLFRKMSDDFFAQNDLESLLGGKVDLAFVDGMHRAEFVLRDIMNLERASRRDSVIIVDDILPEHMEWTTRERHTKAWTGDVYKVIPLLRKHRPDLTIKVFDIKMKGMAVITDFNPGAADFYSKQPGFENELMGDIWAADSIEALRETIDPEPAEMLHAFVKQLANRRTVIRKRASEASLYLDLLKRSLLNEVYLDDELRLLYLRKCLNGEDDYDYATLHNIRSSRSDDLEDLKATRRVGRFPKRKIVNSGFSHTMMGRLRLDSLHESLDDIAARGIGGDLVECGVWRGGGCILMAGWMKSEGIKDRRLIIADSFEGLPKPRLEEDEGIDLSKEKYPQLAVSLEDVRANFAAYDLLDDTSQFFLKGWFCDTLMNAPTDRIALLRMDGDLYESTMDTLEALYDKVTEGGIVIVDDWGVIAACEKAVRDFFEKRKLPLPEIHQIDWTGVWFRKP